MLIRNRIASIAIASTLLVGLGATAANAAPVDSAPASDCTFGEQLVRVWMHLPADLQADLKDLKAATPGADRQQQAKDIRDGALGGEYGPGVQEKAQKLQDIRVRVYADLPAELKADLKDLKAADPADRRALAKDIGEKALAGDYGVKAQVVAERVQGSDFWQNCVAE